MVNESTYLKYDYLCPEFWIASTVLMLLVEELMAEWLRILPLVDRLLRIEFSAIISVSCQRKNDEFLALNGKDHYLKSLCKLKQEMKK